MSHIKSITEAEFEQEVSQSEVPVLCDFGATWCGPCKRQEPILEKVAEELVGKCKGVKIDIDDSHNLAARFGVKSVPTLILFRQGQEVARQVGLASFEKLVGMVEEANK